MEVDIVLNCNWATEHLQQANAHTVVCHGLVLLLNMHRTFMSWCVPSLHYSTVGVTSQLNYTIHNTTDSHIAVIIHILWLYICVLYFLEQKSWHLIASILWRFGVKKYSMCTYVMEMA